MIIAIGVDAHKETSSAYAVYAGEGKENDKHKGFLNQFNKEFGQFPSTPLEMQRLSAFVRGHECHVLLENSTKTHDVYWILKNLGFNVTVAQANELYRITESDKKTDRNDSMELAGYMRRRLHGEKEFAECFIPSPEWMTKREMCRGLSAEKVYLANTKRRIRAHLLLHGIGLNKEYSDITCKSAMNELGRIKDPYLMMQLKFASDAKSRIYFGEKAVWQMFHGDPMYRGIYSIVGFGIVSSAYFTSLIVDIGRFPTCSNFEASFGVVPRKRSSGEHDPNCRTTHKGDELAREMLKHCARVHVRCDEDSVVTKMYKRLVARGKAKTEALIAAGRKLLTVMWAVLKSGKPYTSDPEKLMAARNMAEEDETLTE